MWWRLIWVAFVYLLLGAHFLRSGNPVLCAVFSLLPNLLFFRKMWINRLLQLILLGSVFAVWGVCSYHYVQTRVMFGAPWGRLAIIMTTVSLLTIAAAWCIEEINLRTIKHCHPDDNKLSD